MKNTILLILLLFTLSSYTFKYQKWGVDISHHQGNIKWSEFNKPHLKPSFLFLKATEGMSFKDNKYKEYKNKAEKLNIPVGAYHFFKYSVSGKEQASEFLKFSNLHKGNLIPVLDAEYQKGMPNNKKVTKELLSFIRQIKKVTGKYPIIYCEEKFYKKYLKTTEASKCPLWICNFYYQPFCNYTFWQKTDKYKHPAFKGTIDYNILNRKTPLPFI